jgi:hypothetical protein
VNQRAEIVNRITKAGSLQEQAALVSELDAYDRGLAQRQADARSIDLTDTIVRQTLTPVAVHERSTIATDWLGQIEASSGEGSSNEIIAEAAMWYRRTSPEVRADGDEFMEQARGVARRTASKFGDQAQGLEQQFLEYVAFLNRQAASGLPQVQQLVDSHESPAQTPLNTETFDNFAPEVHPINQGVSGTETSERAPLLQEIEGEGGQGGGQGEPARHDTAPQPYSYAEVPPQAPEQMTSRSSLAEPEEDYFRPSVALGHYATLDDFREGGRLHSEAASGLPQVEQTVDAITEQPAPTPLPEEVAFPWDLEEAQPIDERSDKKAAREQRAAYVAGLITRDPASLSDIERKEILAFTAPVTKTADQWTSGAPQPTQTPVANNPGTTPEGTSGSFSEGYAEGQSDRRNGDAPTFADDSSSAPDYVRGHSEGYGDAARAEQPTGQLPPGAGGREEFRPTGSQKTAAKLTCDNCGETKNHWEMSQRGGTTGAGQWGNTQTLCRTCKPVTQEGYERSASLQVSASFTSPVEQADPDFAKGYKYATKWAPGKPLVTRGSAAFEAGLYAGMSDNPERQGEWTRLHREAAAKYQDRAFLNRLSLHREFSKKVAKGLDGFRVQGAYLRPVEAATYPSAAEAEAAANQSNEDRSNTLVTCQGCGGRGCASCKNSGYQPKTAATTTDLDTYGPASSPNATGETPINGPGTPPLLQGGVDPARPGGPAPYNGAEPFGVPAVSKAAPGAGGPSAVDSTPGGPVDQAAMQRLSPQSLAFRKTVQANLLNSRPSDGE